MGKLNRLFRRQTSYTVGRFNLTLGSDHALPRYQKQFPTYDRFLPSIASSLSGTVVDVGANIGDTIAAMASENSELKFVAVEPDAHFYALLERNCRQIPNNTTLVKAFVADGLQFSGVSNQNGTGIAIAGEGTTPTIGLDEICGGIDDLCLIKADTDGYDWSVLNSGMTTIEQRKPALFFECEVGKSGEFVRNFSEITQLLESFGYQFKVFDNFGAPMTVCNANGLKGLFDYIAAQNRREFHRTIYYVDVFATT